MAASLWHLSHLVVCLVISTGIGVSGQCKEGWLFQDGTCYGFGEAEVTWGDAEELCKVFNGKLAEIETAEENQFLKTMAKAKNLHRLWLGGTDILDEGNWVWVSTDQRIYSFTDWHPGQPDEAGNDEDCLQITSDFNYEWNDYPCHNTANFICEAEASVPVVG